MSTIEFQYDLDDTAAEDKSQSTFSIPKGAVVLVRSPILSLTIRVTISYPALAAWASISLAAGEIAIVTYCGADIGLNFAFLPIVDCLSKHD